MRVPNTVTQTTKRSTSAAKDRIYALYAMRVMRTEHAVSSSSSSSSSSMVVSAMRRVCVCVCVFVSDEQAADGATASSTHQRLPRSTQVHPRNTHSQTGLSVCLSSDFRYLSVCFTASFGVSLDCGILDDELHLTECSPGYRAITLSLSQVVRVI